MIDEKLFNTLKSLGFTESDSKNCYISKESRELFMLKYQNFIPRKL